MAEEESRRAAEAMERAAAAAERNAAASEAKTRADEANTIQSLKDTAVAKQLAEAEKEAAKSAALFKAKMDTATGAAGSLVDAFVTYNKEVYKGEGANKAAAASMEKMGEAAKYAGAFLAILVPGGPIVKALVAGLGLLAKNAMEAGAELARQTDTVYKSYQDLARAGATGKGGMQDVFNSLQKVGLGTQKFGEYLKLVNDNSKDLALFSGTVLQGRKIFENTMESLSDQQKAQLEQMGLDETARAEVTMNYLKQQRLMTMGTKTQMDTSSSAVMKYVKETDELTRITGLNRKDQEKALDEAMSREQFQATLIQIQREHGDAAAQVAKNMHAVQYSISPAMGRRFADSMSGFIGVSEESVQDTLASNGLNMEISEKIRTGQLKTSEAGIRELERLNASYGEFARNNEDLARMGAAGFGGKYMDNVIAGQRAVNGMTESFKKAQKESDDATKGDKDSQLQAKTAIDTQATQLRLQAELNKLMPDYIRDLEATAEKNRALVEATGSLGNEMLNSLSPGMQKLVQAGIDLYEVIEPLLIQLRDFASDNVLPALTESIKWLASWIKSWKNSTPEIESAKSAKEKAFAGSNADWFTKNNALGIGQNTEQQKASADLMRAQSERQGNQFGKGTLSGLVFEAIENLFKGSQPTPGTPAPGTPAPGTPASGTPAPGTPAPGTPAPGTPVQTRAAGGPVTAKTPYLIGEEGPELFVPSMAGDIVPTGQLQGTSGVALRQSQIINDMVSQIVLNTKLLEKTSTADTERATEHSGKMENLFNQIVLNKTAIAKTTDVDADQATDNSETIENLFNQIVIDTKTLEKTADVDAERAKDHSKELKTQREKIDSAIKEIALNSIALENVTKTDLKRAQDYSIFYKGFIETKTKFEKDQLEVINYQMTEGGGDAGGGVPQSRGGSRPTSGTGLKLPAMPGIASMGGGQGMQVTHQDDLKKLGLNIKEGDVQAEGAGINPKLIELARQIQGGIPGFGYFSAFNDKFHQEKAPGSQHAKGLAVDFTVAQPPSVEDGKTITDWLKGLGASLAIDEYNNPTSKSTAGHFHAQIPGFADGGIVDAPTLAQIGEKGPEAIIPLKNGAVPVVMPKDFIEGMSKSNLLLDQAKNKLAETNVSSDTKQNIDDIKSRAVTSVGNAAEMLEVFKQMSDDLKAQGEANRSLFEAMLRGQSTSNDIQSKMLSYAQN